MERIIDWIGDSAVEAQSPAEDTAIGDFGTALPVPYRQARAAVDKFMKERTGEYIGDGGGDDASVEADVRISEYTAYKAKPDLIQGKSDTQTSYACFKYSVD